MWQFWKNQTSVLNGINQPGGATPIVAPFSAPVSPATAPKPRTSGGRVSARDGGDLSPVSAADGAFLPGGALTVERMRRDAQVRSCLTTKRLSVLSEDAHVYPAPGDASDAKRAAQTVETLLNGLPGGIGAVVSGALDALCAGYALGELVWSESTGALVRVRWHDPRRFELLADANGTVAAVRPVGMADALPASRFVLYTYNSRYDSPLGESDLVAAYEPWWRKQTLNRMWLSALDRFGTPPVVATIPTGFAQKDADELARQLARLQTESAITVPAGITVEFDRQRLEPGAGFAAAVSYQDAQIARAILGQELTGQAGTGSGSYALGKVHQGVADDWVQSLRTDLAASLLTHGIARRITEAFFGDVRLTPTIRFPNLTDAELAARRETAAMLLSGKVVAPNEAWIRGWLGVPEGAPSPVEGTPDE